MVHSNLGKLLDQSSGHIPSDPNGREERKFIMPVDGPPRLHVRWIH